MELELNADNAKKYEKIKERCRDELCKAKRLVKLLLEEHTKVTFIFDNLESIQNPTSKELEDKTLKAWVEVLSNTDDVVLLMTSRWLLPECKEYIQLGKPLKVDFLHYISSQNIDFSDKSKIDKVYDTLGGNFRGTNFFLKATKGMSLKDEELFLKKLAKVTEEIQIDMAIEKILSTRTAEEIELLHRLTVYPVSVAREGVRKISLDLPQEALDSLVSFSLIEESFNHEYEVKEYQISALVYEFIANEITLSNETAVLASEFQLYMFLHERKALAQALLTHEALVKVDMVEKLEAWLFDESNREDIELRGLVLNNISVQHLHLANYETALTYLEASLKIQQEIGDKSGEGATLNNISTENQARGDYETALTYLEASLKIRQEIGDNAGLCATLFNMGHIYLQNDKQKQAVESWVTVYVMAKKLGLAQALDALENLAGQLGLENGLESWEQLAQQLNK